MNADVCYQEVYYRFSQIYSDPLNELFTDSLKQVLKMMYSNEFLHVIPVIMFITAIIIFLYEREKLCDLSWLFGDLWILNRMWKGTEDLLCVAICLNAWLTFQRTVYCTTWVMLTEPDDFNELAAATQWWYKPYYIEDKNYIIKFVFPSPHVISWLLCWSVAIIINFLVWPASLYSALSDYILWLHKVMLQKPASKYSPVHEAPSNECLYPYEEEQNPNKSPQISKNRKMRPNKPYSIPSCSENNLMFQ